MNRYELINPQTDEQEAENAAYIARECERIQATWSEGERQRRVYHRITVVTVPRGPLTLPITFADRVHYGRQ